MRIVSWNVNGLRSIYNKGFLSWFNKIDADIVCLQEIKIQKQQIPLDLAKDRRYFSLFNFANKRGYSGVVVFTKQKPIKVVDKINFKRFDKEGRMLKLEFSNFALINIYLPHGGRQKENLNYKLKAYQCFLNCLSRIKNKKIILIGDFNVAHKEADLARPKDNKNNIMFTPEERKQIDRIVELGFVDTFRKFNKGTGYYTWWSYAFDARKRNLGWRIDYAFISKNLKLKNAFILKNVFGSDHCPIGIDIKI
jgi:exodeoxyribonuclease-3